MTGLEEVLVFLGGSICHQLAERSYFYDGTQMPLCARCIGIQFGFAISAMFLLTGARRYASGLPALGQMATLGAIMSFFVIDAVISYSGLSVSSNLRRTLSGLSLGVTIPFLLMPLVNRLLFPGRNPRGLFENRFNWLWLGAIYTLAAAAILLSESSWALFYPVSVIGVIGVFMFYSTIASLEVLLILENRPMSGAHKVTIGVSVAVVALLAMAVLHRLLVPSA